MITVINAPAGYNVAAVVFKGIHVGGTMATKRLKIKDVTVLKDRTRETRYLFFTHFFWDIEVLITTVDGEEFTLRGTDEAFVNALKTHILRKAGKL